MPPTSDVAAALHEAQRAAECRLGKPEQVINASGTASLLPAPADPGPADAVKAAWSPLLPGQAVPLITERYYRDDCD